MRWKVLSNSSTVINVSFYSCPILPCVCFFPLLLLGNTMAPSSVQHFFICFLYVRISRFLYPISTALFKVSMSARIIAWSFAANYHAIASYK